MRWDAQRKGGGVWGVLIGFRKERIYNSHDYWVRFFLRIHLWPHERIPKRAATLINRRHTASANRKRTTMLSMVSNCTRNRTKLHLQHFRNSYDKLFFMLARHYLLDRCHVSVNKMCTHARSNPPFRKSGVSWPSPTWNSSKLPTMTTKSLFKEKKTSLKTRQLEWESHSHWKWVTWTNKNTRNIQNFWDAFVNNNRHSCFPFAEA